jgi:hypothetical protein
MTQPYNAVRELNDDDWLAICENVPSPLTKTARSRLLVDAIIKLMSLNLTWAEATPAPFGETTLYATVNAWAYKDVIEPLVAVLDQRGFTENWDISVIEPATQKKRPHLKQFIGLKLLELKGLHPSVLYIKDWGLAQPEDAPAFVLTQELKVRNAKFRLKLRRRKKKLAEDTSITGLETTSEYGMGDELKIAA